MRRTGRLQIAMVLLLAWAAGFGPTPRVWGQLNDSGYALLIQQSPIEAGTVSPESGVHRVTEGNTMTLQATPRPGYRFLYWLGDVSDPASVNTQVELDSPKIVVAVYERDEFEKLLDANPTGGAGGSGGLVRSAASVSMGGAISGGSYPQQGFSLPVIDQQDPLIDEDDTLGPGDDDDDTLGPDDDPVPEPSTVCLFALGGYLIRRKCAGKTGTSRTGS